MASKFEIEVKASEIRKRRAENIKTLRGRIDECSALLVVMNGNTLEELNEKRYINNCKAHYIELLADEQAAFDNALAEAENSFSNG